MMNTEKNSTFFNHSVNEWYLRALAVNEKEIEQECYLHSILS